jgi:polysaccharide export outer membrane protein
MFRGQMNDVVQRLRPVSVARCTLHVARVAIFLGVALPALAQNPPASQVQQLIQQNPGAVIQKIRQSGLTPDQIRAKLQAAGYSPNLLDQYIQAAQSATPAESIQVSGQISDQTLQALDVLAPTTVPSGVLPLGTEVGVQPGAAPMPLVPAVPGELQLFGTDVFRGRTTQFQPLLAGPVPPNYRVGPGDELILVITGDVEFIHDLVVTREGFIVIPQVGQLSVASLTMDELRMLLRQRL